MFKLRRLYFDSLGVPDNRFSDLTVNLLDLDGEPADTIVWLRNGAGKTTMLSLLLALIRPDRRDFLATRVKKRTLEDLVLGGDTAHVAAEWVDASGQILCTGAVYEWEGRVRPRDYNAAGKDRLRRMWWAIHPDPTVEGAVFDDLPFTLRTRGAVDLGGFKSHIRSLATKGVNSVVADNSITEWHAALRERRFDPDLYRYFGEVNASEGGMDALFTGIDSPGAFVQYLLRFVGDERRAGPVRQLLADNAVEIAKRPTRLAERDFCSEAQPRVAALGEAHDRVVTAAAARDEVRARAGGFRKALAEAAADADAAGRRYTEQFAELEASAREARSSAETSRRQRDEYLRLAAGFRHRAAEAALAKAEAAAAAASLDEEAWQAVGELVERAEREAARQARQAALGAAAATSAPLVEQLTAARARLGRALDVQIHQADENLTALAEQENRWRTDHAEADKDRRSAQAEAVRLQSERDELTTAVERFDGQLRDAVAAGLVLAAERADAAEARLHAAVAEATTAKEAADRAEAAAATAVGAAHTPADDARDAAAEAASDAQRLIKELDHIERRSTDLAAVPLARQVMQAAELDPIGEASDLRARLDAAGADADAQILDLRLDGASDAHAIHALESDGLLPPRSAVAEVVARLGAQGITAHPGWHYLARREPKERHPELIAALPDVVDGVVVYGDPAAAAAALEGVEVADVVVLARASVFAHPGESRMVVGPAPARHDIDAAVPELQARQQRMAARTERLAQLGRRRRAVDELLARLSALLADLPSDGRDGLRHRSMLATDHARSLDEEAEAAHAAFRQAEETRNTAIAERKAAGEALARITAAAASVAPLATDEREIAAPARIRLVAIPALAQAATEAEASAAANYRTAAIQVEATRDRVRGLTIKRREWAQERAPLGTPASEADGVEAERAGVDVLERQLLESFPEADLRRELERAEEAVRAAARKFEGRPPAVRERATELAELHPASADPLLRDEEQAAARRGSLDAAADVATAKREHDDSATEVTQRRTAPGRLRHGDIPVEPADRDDALRRAGAATEDAARHQSVVADRERDRDAAREKSERAAIRAGLLRDQDQMLRDVDVGSTADGTVSSDAEELRAWVRDLAGQVDAADGAHASAMTACSQRADALRTWASSDRFVAVSDDEQGRAVRLLRELFRGDALFDRVAARAVDLAVDLASRQQLIGQLLAEIEVHKRNVVTRLTDLVGDALSDLARASTLSEMPEGVGTWAGHRFLVVEPRERPTREQIEVRVADLVDRMVSGGRIEVDAIELLWKATEAAVTDGFRASVLKPAPDQPTGRTPVEDMRKWSGGENLTASLVLFCVMARLRAEKRTANRSAATGGLVPLDNPLGKANYLPFLELQRRVAAANGIQLVFWTGIGDLGAVTAFPRIAAMHKRPSRTRPGSAYVSVEEDASITGRTHVLDIVEAGRRDP